jgi:DNA-directed RNA polymerase specialized sigma24 family protein
VLQAIPFAEVLLPTQLHDMHVISGLVKSVLARMPSQHREVLLMKYVDGFDVKVIARKLKVSFKSAESLLFRARQQFRLLYLEQDDN